MAAPRRLRRVAEHVGPASVAAGLSFPRTEAYQSVELTAAQARRLRSDPHSEGHDALARLAAGEIPAVIVRSAHGDCAHALRQLAPLYPAEWVANWLDLGSGPEADGLRADATALRGAHAPALDAERARYESYIIGGPNRDPRNGVTGVEKTVLMHALAHLVSVDPASLQYNVAHYIGSSFVGLACLQDQPSSTHSFFTHCAATNSDLRQYLAGPDSAGPCGSSSDSAVGSMFSAINDLAAPLGKHCAAATEQPAVAGGSETSYAPVIVRSHKPNDGYPPHYDSVRRRERRLDVAVAGAETQLAAILLLQGPDERPQNYHDSIMHQLPHDVAAEHKDELGMSALEPGRAASHPDSEALTAFCNKRGIATAAIDLEPGDMYLFKADSVHQVPGFAKGARIVLASFIGYSEDDPFMPAWS